MGSNVLPYVLLPIFSLKKTTCLPLYSPSSSQSKRIELNFCFITQLHFIKVLLNLRVIIIVYRLKLWFFHQAAFVLHKAMNRSFVKLALQTSEVAVPLAVQERSTDACQVIFLYFSLRISGWPLFSNIIRILFIW